MTTTMSLSPYGVDQYRKAKHIAWTKQRKCAVCNKMRSIGQFNGDDALCKQCRRRHVPDELSGRITTVNPRGDMPRTCLKEKK
jgi:hypothetical protein